MTVKHQVNTTKKIINYELSTIFHLLCLDSSVKWLFLRILHVFSLSFCCFSLLSTDSFLHFLGQKSIDYESVGMSTWFIHHSFHLFIYLSYCFIDAKFWVGRGEKPTPNGIRIPDENGRITPLQRYEKKTIVLTLPGDITIFDIGHFGVWCEAFTVDFGHVKIPSSINVPPSLKMLGVSPQVNRRQSG